MRSTTPDADWQAVTTIARSSREGLWTLPMDLRDRALRP
jgi:hypothetical protein